MPRKKKESKKEKEIKSGIIGVYKITNINNNKVYIGESLNIERRWEEHINDLNNNEHHSKKLQVDWNSQGENNFKFEIIQTIDPSDYDSKMGLIQMILYVYEDLNIKKYNSVNEGYNMEYTLERMLNNEKPILFNRWENNDFHMEMLKDIINNIKENNGVYIHKNRKNKTSKKQISKPKNYGTSAFNKKMKNIQFKDNEFKQIHSIFHSAYVFQLLRKNKILNKNNLPYEKYIKNGYFKIEDRECKYRKYKTTLMSKQAFEYILKLIKNDIN